MATEKELEAKKKKAIEDLTSYSASTDNPKAYYIAGQPGAGKSNVVRDVAKNLKGKGFCITIDTDNIRKFHPDYEGVMANNPEKAYEILDSWAMEVAKEVIEHAQKESKNLIFDGTFGGNNPEFLLKSIEQMKEKNYKTEIVALGLNEAYSKIGIQFREELQIKRNGAGRSVDPNYHDSVYQNIPKNIRSAIDKNLFDSYQLYVRDTDKQVSIPFKIYEHQTEGLEFLEEFNKQRNRVVSEKEKRKLIDYLETTEKLMRYNGKKEAKISVFKEYITNSINKLSVREIIQQELPLNTAEQKLFAAINSTDIALITNHKEPLSENFIKELCLSEKIDNKLKVVSMSLLGINNPAELLDNIIKENSVTKISQETKLKKENNNKNQITR